MSARKKTTLAESTTASPLSEVRYSLTELMEKAQAERSSSVLAKELVDQEEMNKMFKIGPVKKKKRTNWKE